MAVREADVACHSVTRVAVTTILGDLRWGERTSWVYIQHKVLCHREKRR